MAITKILLFALGGLVLVIVVRKLHIRLQLSRAKHRSLTGHSRMARRFASLVPFYEYDDATFFNSDSAPAEVAATRRGAFMRLAQLLSARAQATAAETSGLAGKVSDLDFTSRYRVP